MAKTDFTFVGQPHDPLSISGSDPFTGSSDARLAVWYNFDKGWVSTFDEPASIHSDSKAGDRQRVTRMWDRSGNSKTRFGQERHQTVYETATHALEGAPALSQSLYDLGTHLDGDRAVRFGMGVYDDDYDTERGTMRLANVPRFSDMVDGRTANPSFDWGSTWLSGGVPHDYTSTTGISAFKGYSQFAAVKHYEGGYYNASNETGFGFMYGSNKYNGVINDYEYSTFYFGLAPSTTEGPKTFLKYHTKNNSNATQDGETVLYKGFNVISFSAQRSHAAAADAGITHLRTYIAGTEDMNVTTAATNTGFYPSMYTCRIGGDAAGGGGRHGRAEDWEANAGQASKYTAFTDWFVFDDVLSHQRRQQMEKYLSDRIGTAMSSSTFLSSMEGGPEGTAVTHSSLSNALSGNGTYCRAYYQAATASSDYLIQHETCGGGFIRSDNSSGHFYEVSSSHAISLRMHVRAESLNDSLHAGSQAAVVAKATSPFGNQIDHIKGYALKYGTLKDGADTGDTPSFRLSLRNGHMWKDGQTTDGCGDIDLSNDTLGTCAVDTWYTMRLDVIPSGLSYDRIKAYASTNGGSTWLPLKDGSDNTSWDIQRSSDKYRHWSDDTSYNENRVPHPNGTHNGYYITMSSSTGHTIGTKYYVDGFDAKLDKVT